MTMMTRQQRARFNKANEERKTTKAANLAAKAPTGTCPGAPIKAPRTNKRADHPKHGRCRIARKLETEFDAVRDDDPDTVLDDGLDDGLDDVGTNKPSVRQLGSWFVSKSYRDLSVDRGDV